VACYLAVQSSLRGRLDHQLRAQASLIVAASSTNGFPIGRPRPSLKPSDLRFPRPSVRNQGDLAVLSASGVVHQRPGDPTHFTVTAHDLAIARGQAGAYFRNGHAGDTPVRVYVAPAGRGRAVMVAQALTDLNNTLHDLTVILFAIAAAGIAIAVLLGLLVARTAVAPVNLLRRAAEHVRSTGDLSRRISVTGNDDLGRLGRSFNNMLGALEESQRAQRQLVADASHELRTPVATIRTNLEVLARNPDMPPEERAPLLRDLIGESAELGALVEGLLESARESDDKEIVDVVALDEVVVSELERWSRRHPGAAIVQQIQPTLILGRESRLRRALGNLLDNALKWSPPGPTVEVRLDGGTLSIRDHGPGFGTDDLPYVFDRFYRAATARAVPGSGLGLAIVRKVAEEHGGAASAENASDGGAIVSVAFPTLEAPGEDGAQAAVGARS
jgi:two-component system sensor histidine kinase MprB